MIVKTDAKIALETQNLVLIVKSNIKSGPPLIVKRNN